MHAGSRALTCPSSRRKRLTALGMALVLCACATSPHGRSQMTSPAPISDVYSDAEMRLDLATIPNVETPCVDEECELNRAFDQQVQSLGTNIAAAAYDAHPDLIKRISHFEFEVAEKKEPGITSNASGKIVVLRGTQQIGLNEEALTFVIAREMGHVISQHHDENTTTRILLSVAVGLLFPALNLFGNTAVFAQATSASTATSAMVATTAASSATSYLGANLILNRVKPEQLSEADQVALNLLERMGWSHQELSQALADSAAFEPSNAWSEEFLFSVAQVRALESESDAIVPLPEDPDLDGTPEQIETEQLGPLEDAVDPLLNPASITETPAAMPADDHVASIVLVQTSQPAIGVSVNMRDSQPSLATQPATTVRKSARDTAQGKKASSRHRTTAGSNKHGAGKGTKSKPAEVSARSKKPAAAKHRAKQKSVKPAKKRPG